MNEGLPAGFVDLLLSVIADTQQALGIAPEQAEASNGSLEIVAAIEALKAARPYTVWHQLIDVLEADNGGRHEWTSHELRDALPAITELLAAGYFADDPQDLDCSFWQAIAGEESESAEYFSRAPEAYTSLLVVLNRVFDPYESPQPMSDHAPATRPGAAPELGWLLEKHEQGQIKYLRIENLSDAGFEWHADSLKATRFARRQDAEHAAEGGELDDMHIVEHMWVKEVQQPQSDAATPPPQPKDARIKSLEAKIARWTTDFGQLATNAILAGTERDVRISALEKALRDAATSLETISRFAGHDECPEGDKTYMETFRQTRAFARSRADVARAALPAPLARASQAADANDGETLQKIDELLRGKVCDPDPVKPMFHGGLLHTTTYGLVSGLLRDRDALKAEIREPKDASKDAERLTAVDENNWSLSVIEVPFGKDDSDPLWTVKDFDGKELASNADPRAAIDAATLNGGRG